MARVRSISVGTQNVRPHPSEVDVSIQMVPLSDEAVLLQLSSFGSDARASQPKVSQTLQFDRESAILLSQQINRCFGLTPEEQNGPVPGRELD